MAVYLIGDIAAERMSEHSLAVVFMNLIFLAQGGKGVPAVVGSMAVQVKLVQLGIHFLPECARRFCEKLAGAFQPLPDKR